MIKMYIASKTMLVTEMYIVSITRRELRNEKDCLV